jgi:hypothetical protein
MKKLLITAAATAILALAGPASAQVGVGAGPGGVGVQVGPFGAGVGPNYGWDRRDRWDRRYRNYNYAGECRVIRQRVITPSGRRVVTTQRVCD